MVESFPSTAVNFGPTTRTCPITSSLTNRAHRSRATHAPKAAHKLVENSKGLSGSVVPFVQHCPPLVRPCRNANAGHFSALSPLTPNCPGLVFRYTFWKSGHPRLDFFLKLVFDVNLGRQSARRNQACPVFIRPHRPGTIFILHRFCREWQC